MKKPRVLFRVLVIASVVALALSGCEALGAKDSGVGFGGGDTPQRFLQITGDVEKYVSHKTGDPVKNPSALPGEKDFEGVPLTDFVGEAGVSGAPQYVMLLSSGDGFAVRLEWTGAAKAYIIFTEQNGWCVVAPEHPISANAVDLDTIIVVSKGSEAGLRVIRSDGDGDNKGGGDDNNKGGSGNNIDIVSYGKILSSPVLLSYRSQGTAEFGKGADTLTAEVFTKELSVSLADVYEGYGGGGFEVVTKSGNRYLTDGDGRFTVNRQKSDYIEATGDRYEDIAEIRL